MGIFYDIFDTVLLAKLLVAYNFAARVCEKLSNIIYLT